jgi:SAM-dependent methyltransferase
VSQPPARSSIRTRLASADLRVAWEEHASSWVAWARESAHESYWLFHRDLFSELLPPPGRKTLDLGCGEGRLSRDLKALGHDIVGVDASPTMLAAARQADPKIETHLADAAALPFPDGAFDCVVAFMSLQDVDDVAGALRESGRVLEPGGRLCLAIIHPLNSAGWFEGDAADSPFVIRGSYLDPSYYADNLVRDDLEVTLVSAHRPLQVYTDALDEAGLLIERLRELPLPEHAAIEPRKLRWRRLPLFLHLRAFKP